MALSRHERSAVELVSQSHVSPANSCHLKTMTVKECDTYLLGRRQTCRAELVEKSSKSSEKARVWGMWNKDVECVMS